ncbi:MAG: pirin family protein [Methylophilaceae bacterium]|nr:MAG: pirin family protein [Methylophilaceae bacterium]
MIKIRKSDERGYADHGWLNARHSFSFAEYHDPANMGYSVLRVINEDVIAGGGGFGMHSHCDMEIITYILSGELRHRDSLGNGAVIGVGDVQRMTAGSGVRHSEFNASADAPVHLLQIWLLPAENNLPPSYEDKHFAQEQKKNRWCLIASPELSDNALKIHQDVRLYASLLSAQSTVAMDLYIKRCAYLQIAKGEVFVNGIALTAGDAAKIEQEVTVEIEAQSAAELLWFDLPVIE